MIFSYRKLLHLTDIKIEIATIEETNNIKFLGIIFDKHLTFKCHVDVIARKISKSVGILFKLSKISATRNNKNIILLSHQSIFTIRN